MHRDTFDGTRRSFFKRMLLLLAAAAAGPLALRPRGAAAMGGEPVIQGLRRAEGDVRVNGAAALPGASIKPGDVVRTGAKSVAVFVVGKDAFLLRENSEVSLSGVPEQSLIAEIRMKVGKLLSVFGRGKKALITPTAVCGIRGTGIYVESAADRTYVCTCYGTVDIEASTSPGQHETVKTTHHEAPRYIYAGGKGSLIEKAPMLNHTDEELIMLESLVRRKPPFVKKSISSYRDPYQ